MAGRRSVRLPPGACQKQRIAHELGFVLVAPALRIRVAQEGTVGVKARALHLAGPGLQRAAIAEREKQSAAFRLPAHLLALSGGAEYAEDARERIFVQRVGGAVQRSGEGAVLAGVKVACRQGGFIALVAMLGADGGNDGERRNEQQRQREQQRRAQRAAAFPAFFFVPVYGVVKLGHGLIPRFLVFRARSVRRRLII